MTPHDCATQGHRRLVTMDRYCSLCDSNELLRLESLLRRALTDAVLADSISVAFMDGTDAMRDTLIAAILTAARETGR